MTGIIRGKKARNMSLLFAITYMVSYITRINFGAIIAEIEQTSGISRELLSMSVTGTFVTYGMGQVVSGFLGDKISPKKLLFFGLTSTAAMNFLIPFCPDPYFMLAVWCINGFAQSMIYPPLVKISAAVFDAGQYKNTAVLISWGSSVGTIAVYLLSPWIITISGWKTVFFFCGACAVAMMYFWQRYACDVPVVKNVEPEGEKSALHVLFSPLMLVIMFVIVLQGILRDGVQTWMPTYIKDTYGLSSVISILTGVVLPIFSMICVRCATSIYSKKANPVYCAGIVYIFSSLSAVLLSIFTGKSAGMSVVCTAFLSGSMNASNYMMVAMVPHFFRKYGSVSTACGIINACTFVGSAISTYGFAVISERFGWNVTLNIWVTIALTGMLLTFLCVRPWNKRFHSEEQ